MASTNLTMTKLIVSSSTKNLSSTVNFTILATVDESALEIHRKKKITNDKSINYVDL